MQAENKRNTSLTDFGAELYALIYPRGMRSLSQLSEYLKEQGVNVSRQSLAAYANGTRRVPPSLPRKLDKALGLDKDEYVDLAVAVAYGQPDEDPRPKRRKP